MRLRAVQRSVQRSALHGLFGRESFPSGAILHFDASLGFVDQTGNQQAVLIGDALPDYVRAAALNGAGVSWEFDTSEGELRDALLAGEVVLTFNLRMPPMTDFTDATDYSLFGDLLFARVDSGAGSFKLTDGTNTATVAYDWDGMELVSVRCECYGDVMRVGVV